MNQRKKWPSNYLDIQQGTPEWLFERCGQVTASRVKDVVAKLKSGKSSQARETYKLEVLTEILTGRTTEHYVSAAMDFGTENEPLARTGYEIAKDVEVEKIGYVRHATIKRAGCSPDGLVGDDGLVEIKCPNTKTHLNYLLRDPLEESVPTDYIPQMMWQMACTGRSWCDFVSYDPRLPQEFGLFIKRLDRDEALICAMEKEVEQFINEVGELCQKLQAHKAEQQPQVERMMPPRAEIPAWGEITEGPE